MSKSKGKNRSNIISGRYEITSASIGAFDKYGLRNMDSGKRISLSIDELLDGILSRQLEVINAKKRCGTNTTLCFTVVDNYYLEEYKKYKRALMLEATAESDGLGNVSGGQQYTTYFMTEYNNLLNFPLVCDTAVISSRSYIGYDLNYSTGAAYGIYSNDIVFESSQCLEAYLDSPLFFLAGTVSVKDKTEKIREGNFGKLIDTLTRPATDGAVYVSSYSGFHIDEVDNGIRWGIIYDIPVNISSDMLVDMFLEAENKLRENIRTIEMAQKEEGNDTDRTPTLLVQLLQIEIATINAASYIEDLDNIQERVKEKALHNLNRLAGLVRNRIDTTPKQGGNLKRIIISLDPKLERLSYSITEIYKYMRNKYNVQYESLDELERMMGTGMIGMYDSMSTVLERLRSYSAGW